MTTVVVQPGDASRPDTRTRISRFMASRRMVLVAIGVVLMIWVVVIGGLWLRWNEELESIQSEAQRLVASAVDGTDRMLQTAYVVVDALTDRIAYDDAHELFVDEALRRDIVSIGFGSIELVELLLIDRQGRLRVSLDRDGPKLDPRHPDGAPIRYDPLRNYDEIRGGQTQLRLGTPLRLPSGDGVGLPLMRRLEAPDGTFRGVLVAIIRSEAIHQLYAATAGVEGVTIALFSDTGEPLYRFTGRMVAAPPAVEADHALVQSFLSLSPAEIAAGPQLHVDPRLRRAIAVAASANWPMLISVGVDVTRQFTAMTPAIIGVVVLALLSTAAVAAFAILADRLRASVASPAVAAADTMDRALRKHRRDSELLVGLIQLAIVAMVGGLYVVAPKAYSPDAAFTPVPYAVAIYGTLTIVRLILAYKDRLSTPFIYFSVVLDITLLYALLWSFHVQYDRPPAFYLKSPTLFYVFLFIALRTLQLEVRYVIAAGVTAMIGWAGMVAYATGGALTGPQITHDYATYMSASVVLIGAEVEKMLVIGGVTAVLSIAVTRSRRLLLAQARAASLNQELYERTTELNLKLSMEVEDRTMAEELARETAEKLQRNNAELAEANQRLTETQTILVQTEKMAALGGLVAGVAHEVNTPIGLTLTTASFFEAETKRLRKLYDSGDMDEDAFVEYLKTAEETAALIIGNVDRAARLIQSFKQVAVDQTGAERRTFRLKRYVEELLLSLNHQLKRSHIAITVQAGEDVEMDSYPGPLGQVLTNLIMNAQMHAFEGRASGTVRISMEQTGSGLVTITVEDDGRGISETHLKRIFDPFFTTKRSSGGSGLGLHIVYNIVNQTLGGQVRVDSTVGVGTRFHLILPILAPVMAQDSADVLQDKDNDHDQPH